MATNMSAKRLMKELGKGCLPHVDQQRRPPPGIELVQSGSAGSELSDWLFDIRVLDENPIYKDGVYRLKFRFSKSYPIEPPEVTFEKQADRPIPIHPHIYSNGIICLDLLGSQGWSPVQSAQSVCMSIQSMLTSNTKNERPPGDEEFVRGNTLRPRDIEFLYHDNTV
uniref:UBC core domain-containing protein n=1 Tax=Bionectria ochroleuca TaxID=29856 RepID=A0A8H7NAF1_BIOOC